MIHPAQNLFPQEKRVKISVCTHGKQARPNTAVFVLFVVKHGGTALKAVRRIAYPGTSCSAPSWTSPVPYPYRRYASLYFIVGVDSAKENELAILEFIHALVETAHKYFENVCELTLCST